jgi:hypothetical protein
MAPGITQPVTEPGSTRKISGGKAQPAHKADSLATICESNVSTVLDPRHLTTPRPIWPVAGIALLVLCCIHCVQCVLYCLCNMCIFVLCLIVLLSPGKIPLSSIK